MNSYKHNKQNNALGTVASINGQNARQFILAHPKQYKPAQFPFQLNGTLFTKSSAVHKYVVDCHGDMYEVGARFVWLHNRID